MLFLQLKINFTTVKVSLRLLLLSCWHTSYGIQMKWILQCFTQTHKNFSSLNSHIKMYLRSTDFTRWQKLTRPNVLDFNLFNSYRNKSQNTYSQCTDLWLTKNLHASKWSKIPYLLLMLFVVKWTLLKDTIF